MCHTHELGQTTSHTASPPWYNPFKGSSFLIDTLPPAPPRLQQSTRTGPLLVHRDTGPPLRGPAGFPEACRGAGMHVRPKGGTRATSPAGGQPKIGGLRAYLHESMDMT